MNQRDLKHLRAEMMRHTSSESPETTMFCLCFEELKSASSQLILEKLFDKLATSQVLPESFLGGARAKYSDC